MLKRLMNWMKAVSLQLSISPMRLYALPIAVAVLLLSLPTIAATIVEAQQGQPGNKGGWFVRGFVANGTAIGSADPPILVAGQDGTNLRTLLTDAQGRLITTGGTMGQVYTPNVPTECALAAATSCPLTAFAAAGSCVELWCSVDAFFRFGTGAQVAVTTDTAIPAKTTRRFCETSAQDSAAFISASAGTCKLGVVPKTP